MMLPPGANRSELMQLRHRYVNDSSACLQYDDAAGSSRARWGGSWNLEGPPAEAGSDRKVKRLDNGLK